MSRLQKILRAREAVTILARTPAWEHLSLPGWTDITPAAARLLANRAGNLYFQDLLFLTAKAASELGAHHSRIREMLVNPAEKYFPPGSYSFTIHGYRLALPKIRSLSIEAAKGLAQHIGCAALNGKMRLSQAAARELAYYRGCGLTFLGPTYFSPSVLKELAHYRGPLNLDGLMKLSLAQAEALSSCKGFPSLRGLKTLSAQAAKLLTRDAEEMELCGVRQISDEVAEIIGQSNCRVILHGLNKLTDKQYQLLMAKAKTSVDYSFFDLYDRTPYSPARLK